MVGPSKAEANDAAMRPNVTRYRIFQKFPRIGQPSYLANTGTGRRVRRYLAEGAEHLIVKPSGVVLRFGAHFRPEH